MGDGAASAYLILYIISVAAAVVIGASKGKGGTGFVLGLLLSWLGVVFALFLSPTAEAQGRSPCPFCAEPILPEALVCPHCRHAVTRLASPPRGTKEGWLQDPSGRHPLRWWDGDEWTKHVGDAKGGTRSEDPPVLDLV